MSKFDGILSAKSSGNTKTGSKSAAGASAKKPEKKIESKRVGKRSDPEYTQVTGYIKKITHEEVMRKIYKHQEFSELLETLLTDWLKKP